MKYLGYMKLRSGMDGLLENTIWFNEDVLTYLRGVIDVRALPHITPSIRIRSYTDREFKRVRVSWPLRYEQEYVSNENFIGFTSAYMVELLTGDPRIKFDIYYEMGTLKCVFENRGKHYFSSTLPDGLEAFLTCIYEEVKEIHTKLREQ